MINFFSMLGASFTLVFILMICLWVVYLFQRNAGVVDIGWGIGFLLVAWSCFFFSYSDFWKTLIMTLMATFWAIRLTQYVFLRFQSNKEDPRYEDMRSRWGGDPTNSLFLMMFIFQGMLIILISIPFFLVAVGSNPNWGYSELWGIVLWAIGVAGEYFADKQLIAFKQDPANSGKVCQRGWWRYSRHPNYFFETIVWFGFALFAFSANWGVLAFISPIAVLILLLNISGVPLAEAQALRSKGDLYRDYQKTTSSFIPWFPKKTTTIEIKKE